MKNEPQSPSTWLLALPETGFLRLPEVLRFFPVGRSSWYKGIKRGIYPAPVPLGPRTAAWRAEDIRRLIAETGAKS